MFRNAHKLESWKIRSWHLTITKSVALSRYPPYLQYHKQKVALTVNLLFKKCKYAKLFTTARRLSVNEEGAETHPFSMAGNTEMFR